MPLKKSDRYKARKKMLAENPTNPVSILLSGQSIIPESFIERIREERQKYVNMAPNETKPVIGDNMNTTIACYGSTTTTSSGWGSFPSSDTATFGGSGTEGAIQS